MHWMITLLTYSIIHSLPLILPYHISYYWAAGMILLGARQRRTVRCSHWRWASRETRTSYWNTLRLRRKGLTEKLRHLLIIVSENNDCITQSHSTGTYTGVHVQVCMYMQRYNRLYSLLSLYAHLSLLITILHASLLCFLPYLSFLVGCIFKPSRATFFLFLPLLSLSLSFSLLLLACTCACRFWWLGHTCYSNLEKLLVKCLHFSLLFQRPLLSCVSTLCSIYWLSMREFTDRSWRVLDFIVLCVHIEFINGYIVAIFFMVSVREWFIW